MLYSFNKHLAFSTRVLFNLSAIPFSCGEYGGMISEMIPFLVIKSLNILETYSPPPSETTFFIWTPNWVLINLRTEIIKRFILTFHESIVPMNTLNIHQ